VTGDSTRNCWLHHRLLPPTATNHRSLPVPSALPLPLQNPSNCRQSTADTRTPRPRPWRRPSPAVPARWSGGFSRRRPKATSSSSR
uniref:Uncharacterized protein n=1 Tax=Aegilops tauschii subsp. strangulata TaxID=200361 RepID=A0A453GJ14_AEGTS